MRNMEHPRGESPRSSSPDSALQLLALILCGAVIVLLLLVGFNLLSASSIEGARARWIGVCLILFSVVTLYLSAQRWARWVPALAVLLSIKFALVLIVGTTLVVHPRPASRVLALEYLTILLVLLWSSVDFVVRIPSKAERLVLACLVVSVALSILQEPNILPLAVTISILLFLKIVRKRSMAKLLLFRK
jgi:hypothetical protein